MTKITTISTERQNSIEDRILTIHNVQVILDEDIASQYGVTTGRLNEQVKRIQKLEIAKCDSKLGWKKKSTLCIYRVRSFYVERDIVFLVSNAQVFQRLDKIEYHLIESDRRIEDIYSKLEEKSLEHKQGIFYDGQIYDSYIFTTNLIRSATERIVLIDNYVDESVLSMLDKRNNNVDAIIYTMRITNQFQLDICKHDAQYPPIRVKVFTKAHDRFLIIDDKVYHFGASLKDLGKKWFAFSLMERMNPDELISKL